MKIASYPIAAGGLGTNFAESELPIEFARKFRNRYINTNGSAEKRQGFALDGTAGAGLTNAHELVNSDGTITEFESGNGIIYLVNGSARTQIHSVSSTGKLRASQFGDKLIFNNGVNRDFYTEDGSTFKELKAIVEMGQVSAATATSFEDPDITNWLGTDVALNDIVYNVSRNTSGVVTAIASATITHTSMGSAGDGLGSGTDTQNADRYEIIDTVELNIIDFDGQLDNVAISTTGTTTTIVAVSGTTFSDTKIREGDYLYNTTRGAVTDVTSVSANLNCTAVSAQTAGDTFVFLKSAMPISSYQHVHYGRRYSVDARDKRKIRISGANDPTDMTSDAGTLDAVTFSFGTQQPEGNTVVSMTSFQRFLVLGGKKAVLTFQGTVPFGTDADFTPVGLFQQGLVSPDGLISTGNDAVFLSADGLQSLRFGSDSSSLNRVNLSEPVRNDLRTLIANTSEDLLQLIHYPRRSFIICKVGTDCYVFNYGSLFTSRGFQDRYGSEGSWSVFDGLFGECAGYYVKSNGDLKCFDSGGNSYLFDQGTYDDNGASILTEYQTAWLSLNDPKRFPRRKQGKYIKPNFEAASNIQYTVAADSNFNRINNDTLTASSSGQSQPIGTAVIGTDAIGGGSVANVKYPLRWNGEVVRISFTNENTLGPDTLNSFTLYANEHGRR